MTPDQIFALAVTGESEKLEFKKSTAERDRACRTLRAFANGHLPGSSPANRGGEGGEAGRRAGSEMQPDRTNYSRQ